MGNDNTKATGSRWRLLALVAVAVWALALEVRIGELQTRLESAEDLARRAMNRALEAKADANRESR